jgi:hypothetical protein
VSYDFHVPAPSAPGWRALREAIALDDLRALPGDDAAEAWPARGLRLCRAQRSVRITEVDWNESESKLTVVLRALPSPDDCDLALRVVEAAAQLAGASTVEADYFGAIEIGEVRRLHTADWMHEQAESGARILAQMIREGRGPMSMPGPNRSCYIGERLLAELEAAGPPTALADRVLATMRRVQWDVPAGFRNAGVFVSGDKVENEAGGREVRFAVWLPDENLVIPRVDYVALRVTTGEVVMVPFAAVAELAGPHGTLLDECQLLIRSMSPTDWEATTARARPLAKSPRK